jgi:hypothetical protein
MAARILTKYRISRYPASIARYKMLRHRPDTPNQLRLISYQFFPNSNIFILRFKTLELSSALRSIDGLSNLQYTMVNTIKEKLFTRIQVFYNETSIRSSVAHIKKKNTKLNRPKT